MLKFVQVLISQGTTTTTATSTAAAAAATTTTTTTAAATKNKIKYQRELIYYSTLLFFKYIIK